MNGANDVLLPETGLRELHLFAGIGGGILGGILLGHRTIGAVEIEPYCRKVLFQRQRDGILPWFPIWDDIKTFDGKPWRGIADVVCGGFPCQDISSAGRGAGIEGERSGLWAEMARVICEVQPKYAFVENSPMLTSRGLGKVLGDLAAMGYDARWGVYGACDVGAPHERERIWILADSMQNKCLYRRLFNENNGEKERRLEPAIGGKNWNGFEMGQSYNPISLEEEIHSPDSPGMADGVADWLDRVKAAGNGQVPQVAKFAWETLMG